MKKITEKELDDLLKDLERQVELVASPVNRNLFLGAFTSVRLCNIMTIVDILRRHIFFAGKVKG